MSRDALLELATPHIPDVPNLRALVTKGRSAAGADACYRRAQSQCLAPGRFRRATLDPRHVLRSVQAHYFEVIVLFVCAAGALIEHALLRWVALTAALFLVGLYSVYCLVRLSWLERQADMAWYDVYLLRPATGLRASQEARDLLATGCKRVSAWYDTVIAEGRVMRRIDVAVMQALYRSTGRELPAPTCFDLLAQRKYPTSGESVSAKA